MSKKKRYLQDIRFLKSLVVSAKDESIRQVIDKYLRLSKPYYTAKQSPQSLETLQGRCCDLAGGFPFTSVEYPWPRDDLKDEYLQPILQLNLRKVSRLLRADLGSGLLQVWGYSAEKYGHLKFELRIILTERTKTATQSVYPGKIAQAMRFNSRFLANPKLQWRAGGQMFLGTFEYVSSLDINDFAFVNPSEFAYDEPVDDYVLEMMEEWGDNWQHEMLLSINNLPYFGTYLGGYGGSYGSRGRFLNVNPSSNIVVLQLVSSEDDACLGVVATRNEAGAITFKTQQTYL